MQIVPRGAELLLLWALPGRTRIRQSKRELVLAPSCMCCHTLAPHSSFAGGANAAETSCAQQQFFSSLLSRNSRCRKPTSVSQTADSVLFTKMARTNMQKTESLRAFHHLTLRGKGTKKACKNDTITTFIMKLQGKDSIQVLSVKPLTPANGSPEPWVSRTEFWLPTKGCRTSPPCHHSNLSLLFPTPKP